MIARLAAVKRGLRNTERSSSGSVVRRSHATKPASAATARAKLPRIRPSVQPRSGAWMIAVDEGAQADERQGGADQVEAAGVRVARRRHEQASADERQGHDRQVHEEHRAPVEVLEQQAAGDRAEGDADAGRPRPDARWPSAFRRVGEDVGEDRQRRREDERGAEAHHRPGRRELAGRAGQGRQRPSRRRRSTAPR